MLDPTRETFCQEYNVHGNASEAYRKAKPRAEKWKPEAVHVNACRMLSEPKVKLRLQELQKMSAAKYDITIEKLTQMTIDAYNLAMEREVKAPSAAVKASEFLGKLHGLLVEKRELSGPDGVPLIPSVNVTISRPKS